MITREAAEALLAQLEYSYGEMPTELKPDGRMVRVVTSKPKFEVYVDRSTGREEFVKATFFAAGALIARLDESGRVIPESLDTDALSGARWALIQAVVSEAVKANKAGIPPEEK